jgi:putative aldouronate transport system substrate-binding protein
MFIPYFLIIAFFIGCGGGNANQVTTVSQETTAGQTSTAEQATTSANNEETTAPAASGTDYSSVEQTQDKSTIPIMTEGPLGRYPETITVRMVKGNDAGDWRWEHLAKVGETIEDNRFTRKIKTNLNIDVVYDWIVDNSQYDQRMKLAISSGDLPDFLRIPAHMRSDLMQLAEADMILAIDDLWDEYVSPLTKQISTEDGGLVMASIAYKGKMMGVPSVTAGIHVTPHFWVRTDWMNKLGLTPPNTMDEYYTFMQDFSQADINGDGSKVYGMMLAGRNEGLGFWDQLEGIFVGFDAYPVQWIKNDAGDLVWGATLPEMKEGLRFINKLYNDGLIDPEFTVKDMDAANQILASGHAATTFYWHWATHSILNHSRENDPNADWEVFDTPTATGKPARKRMELGLRGVFVANKKTEHPEAIIKMMNLYNEWSFGENADFEYFHQPFIDGTLVNDIWGHGPVDGLHAQIDTANIEAIQPAFSGEIDPATLTGTAKSFYENCMAEWTWMRMFGPGNTPGLQMVKAFHDPDNLIKYNYFVGAPTPTMIERWAQLLERTNTMAIQCFTGEVDINSAFEAFVNDWNQLGGEQVTQEVNEWYKSNN